MVVFVSVFGGPTLFVEPLFDDLFFVNNFHLGLPVFKVHPRKPFTMHLAQLGLIAMVVWRPKHDARYAALCDKIEVAFGWFGFRPFCGVILIQILLKNVLDAFGFIQPDRAVNLAQPDLLLWLIFLSVLCGKSDLISIRALKNQTGNIK